jgi:hypothetical protein
MAFDRTRTLRGALAGGVAAGAWLAQQPLDQRAFGVRSDDAELLARLSGGGPAAGVVLHLERGALFGALYAAAAPRLPGPALLRGPLAALAGHLATWPAVARADAPVRATGRAFAQSAWRHLLFGVVLGELERRLNPPGPDLRPVDDEAVASNGRGPAARVAAGEPAGR